MNDVLKDALPKPDLKKFFNPASVALVGATDDMAASPARC